MLIYSALGARKSTICSDIWVAYWICEYDAMGLSVAKLVCKHPYQQNTKFPSLHQNSLCQI